MQHDAWTDIEKWLHAAGRYLLYGPGLRAPGSYLLHGPVSYDHGFGLEIAATWRCREISPLRGHFPCTRPVHSEHQAREAAGRTTFCNTVRSFETTKSVPQIMPESDGFVLNFVMGAVDVFV